MYPSPRNKVKGTFVKTVSDYLKVESKVVCVTKGESKVAYIQYVIASIMYYLKYSSAIHYIHYPRHSSLFLPFVFWLKRRVVLHFHGSDLLPEKRLSHLLYPLVLLSISRAEKVIVPSEYYKKILLSKFKSISVEVVVSPSGGVKLYSCKTEWSANSPVKFGFIGRLREDKGVLKILEAFKLRQQHCLLLAGTPDSKKVKNIIDLSTSQYRNITYVGPVNHSEIVEFYDSIDYLLFWSTRKSESLGLVMLEAAARGVPVIGYRNGAFDEIFGEDYILGYQKCTLDTLIRAIDDASELSIHQYLKISKNNFNRIKRYDRDLVMNELGQILS